MRQYNYTLKHQNKIFKKSTAKLILWFLGRGLQSCSVLDDNVKKEIQCFEEKTSILLKIEPSGPCMLLSKENSKLKFVGLKEVHDADLAIYFKNIEGAIAVLTGKISIAQSYAEHRFVMKGNVASGMCLVRCLCILESYLFPKFIVKKILKPVPVKNTSSFRIYISALFDI